jgi:tetratricopeptide (TPR) repeat protein
MRVCAAVIMFAALAGAQATDGNATAPSRSRLRSGPTGAQAPASPSSPLLQKGLAAEKAGRTGEAIRLLKQALMNTPPREVEGQARLELLRIFERGGQWWEAAGQLRELRRLVPLEAEYAYQLGVVYRNLARSSYQQLRSAGPDSARYQQMLGEQLSAAGETEKAIEAFRRAISADPKLSGPHLALSVVYLRMNKRTEALAEIDQELTIAPESVVAKQVRQAIIGVKE